MQRGRAEPGALDGHLRVIGSAHGRLSGGGPRIRGLDGPADHGRPQRHARLVLRRRGVVRLRRARSSTARELRRARAPTILDVGGESTRPGAEPVRVDEELRRVVPVVAGACAARARRSASTPRRPRWRAAALDAGATYVNDVTAFRQEPELAGSSPSAAATAASCTCWASRARCRTTRATTTSSARSPRSSSSALAFAMPRASRGAHPGRPRDRLRQDVDAQPRAAAPPGRDRRARLPGGHRHLAQVVPRRAHRARGPARARRGDAWRRPCSRSSAGQRLPRPRRRADAGRAGGGDCYVARRWRLTTTTSSTTTSRTTRTDDDDERGAPQRASRSRSPGSRSTPTTG